MRVFLFALPLALAGCVGQTYRCPDPNPFATVRRVAVAPFRDATGLKVFDGVKAGDAFASELILHPGFQLVRPAVVAEEAAKKGLKLDTAENCIAVARALDADAIVVAELTEVEFYYPPRTSVAFQLILTQRVKASPEEIERHVTSARPLPVTPDNACNLGQQWELVADGGDDNIKAELCDYADARVVDDSPWRDGEGIARSRDPWWRFICALLAQSMVDVEMARGQGVDLQSRPSGRWHLHTDIE